MNKELQEAAEWIAALAMADFDAEWNRKIREPK